MPRFHRKTDFRRLSHGDDERSYQKQLPSSLYWWQYSLRHWRYKSDPLKHARASSKVTHPCSVTDSTMPHFLICNDNFNLACSCLQQCYVTLIKCVRLAVIEGYLTAANRSCNKLNRFLIKIWLLDILKKRSFFFGQFLLLSFWNYRFTKLLWLFMAICLLCLWTFFRFRDFWRFRNFWNFLRRFNLNVVFEVFLFNYNYYICIYFFKFFWIFL